MYAEKSGVHSGQQRCKTNPVLSSRTAVAGAREGAFRRLGITPWIAGDQKPPRGRDGRVQTITKGGRQTLKRKRSSAERSFASPAQADHEDPALACAIVESLRYAPATGTPISEQASSQPTGSPSKRGAESDPDETSMKSDDRTEEGKCRGLELKRASGAASFVTRHERNGFNELEKALEWLDGICRPEGVELGEPRDVSTLCPPSLHNFSLVCSPVIPGSLVLAANGVRRRAMNSYGLIGTTVASSSLAWNDRDLCTSRIVWLHV